MRLGMFPSLRQQPRSRLEGDIASILDAGGSGLEIKSGDISAVIWLHSHFGHIGD